ncbi:hypothetical protein EVAR_80870_1 [Eumeta japonica]|uniref:Uncharacterized protein n=1 Tax=Eumeta variegata TaxID=151549 RepID=A0A4C1V1Y9_EUMVA|nr:hypothetical protein EVAR_80870_1 [Eumeta japonica]
MSSRISERLPKSLQRQRACALHGVFISETVTAQSGLPSSSENYYALHRRCGGFVKPLKYVEIHQIAGRRGRARSVGQKDESRLHAFGFLSSARNSTPRASSRSLSAASSRRAPSGPLAPTRARSLPFPPLPVTSERHSCPLDTISLTRRRASAHASQRLVLKEDVKNESGKGYVEAVWRGRARRETKSTQPKCIRVGEGHPRRTRADQIGVTGGSNLKRQKAVSSRGTVNGTDQLTNVAGKTYTGRLVSATAKCSHRDCDRIGIGATVGRTGAHSLCIILPNGTTNDPTFVRGAAEGVWARVTSAPAPARPHLTFAQLHRLAANPQCRGRSLAAFNA